MWHRFYENESYKILPLKNDWLVGHILDKMNVIWFSNPYHFLKMSNFVAAHVTKMWFLKLWITPFWKQMKKENVENMIPARCLKEALVTWPLSASGLLKAR